MAYRVVTKITPVAPNGATWTDANQWITDNGPVGTGQSIAPHTVAMDPDGVSIIRTITYENEAQHTQHESTKDADFGDAFIEEQISAGEV